MSRTKHLSQNLGAEGGFVRGRATGATDSASRFDRKW